MKGKLKKAICMALATTMVFSMTACFGKDGGGDTSDALAQASDSANAKEAVFKEIGSINPEAEWFDDVLVDGEEVSHLLKNVAGERLNASICVVIGILEGNCNDLLVVLAVIEHGDNSDRITLHQHQRIDRLVAQQQHIQRISVVCKSTGYKTVVCRIMCRGVQDSVKNYESCLLVQLILLLASLFDLNNCQKIMGSYACGVNVMPDVHFMSSFLF